MGVSLGTIMRHSAVFSALLALAAGQSQYQSGSAGGGFGGASDVGFGGSSGGYDGASDTAGGAGSLEETIPGVPGDDYPIFAVVPETSFLCDGQVDGGYYADPEAECQAFTSVLEMAQEDSPSTASSAPMALCSSSSIFSVTGGSMWTAPLPRTSGHSMRKLQQKEKQTLLQELEVISMPEAREEVEEEQEGQEAIEVVPAVPKALLLLQEVHILPLQEDKVLLPLQEDLVVPLGDMHGTVER